MPSHRTTGLRPAQFTTLLALLTNTLTWNTPNTKPHKLTLTQGLKATLLYLRQNQTEEFLAEDFGFSQPTISRILNKIETALLHVLAPAVPPIPETLLQSSGTVIVDGTLVPTYNWHGPRMRLYSGKHHCAGFNHQIICTLDGVPLVITYPVPGAHHDTFAYRWHGLDRFLDPHDTLADKGYQGLDLITPVKTLPGGELTDDEKHLNRHINHHRVVIERVIAHFKCWRVLSSIFRRPLTSYRRVFSVVRALFFWIQNHPNE